MAAPRRTLEISYHAYKYCGNLPGVPEICRRLSLINKVESVQNCICTYFSGNPKQTRTRREMKWQARTWPSRQQSLIIKNTSANDNLGKEFAALVGHDPDWTNSHGAKVITHNQAKDLARTNRRCEL